MRPLDDDRAAYSFHFYPFFQAKRFAGLAGGALEAEIARCLHGGGAIADLRERFRAPIWCGETGIPHAHEDRPLMERLFDGTLRVLNREGISWSVWTYKDGGGMGAYAPGRRSAWERLVRHVLPDWDFLQELAVCMPAAEAHARAECPGLQVDDRLRREIAYRQLAITQLERVAHMRQKLRTLPADDLLSAADALAFRACRPWKRVVNAVARQCGAPTVR